MGKGTSFYLSVLFSFVPLILQAYDTCQEGIYYNIVSEERHLVEIVATDVVSLAENVTVPETVQIGTHEYEVAGIADNAFSGCDKLRTLALPATVKTIGVKSFHCCSHLSSFSGCLASADSRCLIVNDMLVAFAPYGLNDYSVPRYVKSLSPWVFASCENLTAMLMPDSLTEIGGYAFYACTSLSELDLPDSLTSVDVYAFSGCTLLEEVTIPDKVLRLGEGAFQNCSSMASVTIGKALSRLEYNTFSNCTELSEVHCRSVVPPAATFGCFSGILEDCALYVPIGARQKYMETEVWKNFTSITEEDIDTREKRQCSSPTVRYCEGQLFFDCITEGAKFHYTLMDSDVQTKEVSLNEGVVPLSACYNISVYATADGYKASDIVKAQLFWVSAKLDPSALSHVNTIGVMASCHRGVLSLNGAPKGCVVRFFDINGTYLGNSCIENDIMEWHVPAGVTVLIAKIGSEELKIRVD